MIDKGDDLKAFLDTVLTSQSSSDETWRNMGRWYGLYFLGTQDAGLDIATGVQLTLHLQEDMLRAHREQQDQ